jgi:hypothetical protein
LIDKLGSRHRQRREKKENQRERKLKAERQRERRKGNAQSFSPWYGQTVRQTDRQTDREGESFLPFLYSRSEEVIQDHVAGREDRTIRRISS